MAFQMHLETWEPTKAFARNGKMFYIKLVTCDYDTTLLTDFSYLLLRLKSIKCLVSVLTTEFLQAD